MTDITNADDIPPGDVTKIGITYNLKDPALLPGEVDSEQVEEFDHPETVNALCAVFGKYGFETINLGGDINIVEKIRQERPDFVFNISEGYHGRNRESHVPAILEMMDIPYSGSDPLTLALALDKSMTKKFLAYLGILTPRYILIKTINEIINVKGKLRYPLITKPAWEGSSKGIYDRSKADNRQVLEQNIEYLFDKYPNQPVLIEEYIKGREIAVGIVGNNPKSRRWENRVGSG